MIYYGERARLLLAAITILYTYVYKRSYTHIARTQRVNFSHIIPLAKWIWRMPPWLYILNVRRLKAIALYKIKNVRWYLTAQLFHVFIHLLPLFTYLYVYDYLKKKPLRIIPSRLYGYKPFTDYHSAIYNQEQ